MFNYYMWSRLIISPFSEFKYYCAYAWLVNRCYHVILPSQQFSFQNPMMKHKPLSAVGSDLDSNFVDVGSSPHSDLKYALLLFCIFFNTCYQRVNIYKNKCLKMHYWQHLFLVPIHKRVPLMLVSNIMSTFAMYDL